MQLTGPLPARPPARTPAHPPGAKPSSRSRAGGEHCCAACRLQETLQLEQAPTHQVEVLAGGSKHGRPVEAARRLPTVSGRPPTSAPWCSRPPPWPRRPAVAAPALAQRRTPAQQGRQGRDGEQIRRPSDLPAQSGPGPAAAAPNYQIKALAVRLGHPCRALGAAKPLQAAVAVLPPLVAPPKHPRNAAAIGPARAVDSWESVTWGRRGAAPGTACVRMHACACMRMHPAAQGPC